MAAAVPDSTLALPSHHLHQRLRPLVASLPESSKMDTARTHPGQGPFNGTDARTSSHSPRWPSNPAANWLALRGSNEHKGPLKLLDLPIDILQLIMKEVTHTNDLVALALSHSAINRLVTPQIYSRFDIVWPDSTAQTETRSGVDALTYGLATLVMSEDIFRASRPPTSAEEVEQCKLERKARRRRGNHYAHFTRKFSLGNGPEAWVKDYASNTEAGKMLGTLVALAVAQMRNLETFIWDMPTGILPDVWDALASLNEHDDGLDCQLEKVWIRWHAHNPTRTEKKLAQPWSYHPRNQFWVPFSQRSHPTKEHKLKRITRPTFSMLPPLKSLNVLDIDLCDYLDEMALLIQSSKLVLRELKVGVASYAVADEWNLPHKWSENLQQQEKLKPKLRSHPHSMYEKRAGGVLGVLFGHVYDLREHCAENQQEMQLKDGITKSTAATLRSPRIIENLDDRDDEPTLNKLNVSDAESKSRLQLSVLALERVSLCIQTVAAALTWTYLREITLLDCQHTASFWQHLTSQYTPTIPTTSNGYELNVKSIHTSIVNPSLIAFCREALEPNSLETIFLQQSEYHVSKVPLEAIMKMIKRHRGSLRRLYVDSRERDDSDSGAHLPEGAERWLFNREELHYVTRGKVPGLRELGVNIRLKDWHFFIRRLPLIPHLRALYLPFIAKNNSRWVEAHEAKELAHQVVDVCTIRPEVELCYIAVASKCFEVVESRQSVSVVEGEQLRTDETSDYEDSEEDSEDVDDEDDEVDEEDEHEDEEDDEAEDLSIENGSHDQVDSADESEADADNVYEVKMEIREILFYDDKVAIFKARHGRI